MTEHSNDDHQHHSLAIAQQTAQLASEFTEVVRFRLPSRLSACFARTEFSQIALLPSDERFVFIAANDKRGLLLMDMSTGRATPLLSHLSLPNVVQQSSTEPHKVKEQEQTHSQHVADQASPNKNKKKNKKKKKKNKKKSEEKNKQNKPHQEPEDLSVIGAAGLLCYKIHGVAVCRHTPNTLYFSASVPSGICSPVSSHDLFVLHWHNDIRQLLTPESTSLHHQSVKLELGLCSDMDGQQLLNQLVPDPTGSPGLNACSDSKHPTAVAVTVTAAAADEPKGDSVHILPLQCMRGGSCDHMSLSKDDQYLVVTHRRKNLLDIVTVGAATRVPLDRASMSSATVTIDCISQKLASYLSFVLCCDVQTLKLETVPGTSAVIHGSRNSQLYVLHSMSKSLYALSVPDPRESKTACPSEQQLRMFHTKRPRAVATHAEDHAAAASLIPGHNFTFPIGIAMHPSNNIFYAADGDGFCIHAICLTPHNNCDSQIDAVSASLVPSPQHIMSAPVQKKHDEQKAPAKHFEVMSLDAKRRPMTRFYSCCVSSNGRYVYAASSPFIVRFRLALRPQLGLVIMLCALTIRQDRLLQRHPPSCPPLPETAALSVADPEEIALDRFARHSLFDLNVIRIVSQFMGQWGG
jgi:hypothetical protein